MDLPSRRSPPGWLPFAVLAVAAGYLALRWGSIPPRWTVHWDARGNPNGWATHDVAGVFGPLLIGGAVIALVEMAGWATRIRARGPNALRAIRMAGAHFVRLMSCGLATVFAFLALQLPLGPPMPVGLLATLPLVPLLIAVLLGGARMTKTLIAVRRGDHGDDAVARVEGYHGLYYANAKDARLWVPKRFGVGWTLNFAHPFAWPVLLLIVAVPVVLLVVAGRAH